MEVSVVETAAKDGFMLPRLLRLQWVCVVIASPLGPRRPLQRCVAHLPKIVATQVVILTAVSPRPHTLCIFRPSY